MKGKGLIYLVFLLLFAASVAAQPLTRILDPFQGVDFGTLYQSSYLFIDAIIYLLIFMGLAKFVFTSTYKKHSKPIIIGIGLALTFAMSVFSATTGFNLGSLGNYAALIILFLLIFMIFNVIKTFDADTATSASLGIIIGYSMLRTAFFPLYAWLIQEPLLDALIHIALLVAVIVLIIRLFSLFGRSSSDPESSGEPGVRGENGERGAPGEQGAPGQTRSPEGNGNTQGGGQGEGPSARIRQPSHNHIYQSNDDLILEATISGGTGPYTYEWFVDGGSLLRGHADGGFSNNLGKVHQFARVLQPGNHALVLGVTDSRGMHSQDGVRFSIAELPEIDVQITEPNPTTQRTFRMNEVIPVKFNIRQGQPPYKWIVYLNGANQSHAVASVSNETRTEEIHFMIRPGVKQRESEEYLRKTGDNLLRIEVYDQGRHREQPKVAVTRFRIDDPNNLNIVWLKPEPDEVLYENEPFDLTWQIQNQEYNNQSVFTGNCTINHEGGERYEGLRVEQKGKNGKVGLHLPAGTYYAYLALQDANDQNKRGVSEEKKITVLRRGGPPSDELDIEFREPPKQLDPGTAFPIEFEVRNTHEGKRHGFSGTFTVSLAHQAEPLSTVKITPKSKAWSKENPALYRDQSSTTGFREAGVYILHVTLEEEGTGRKGEAEHVVTVRKGEEPPKEPPQVTINENDTNIYLNQENTLILNNVPKDAAWEKTQVTINNIPLKILASSRSYDKTTVKIILEDLKRSSIKPGKDQKLEIVMPTSTTEIRLTVNVNVSTGKGGTEKDKEGPEKKKKTWLEEIEESVKQVRSGPTKRKFHHSAPSFAADLVNRPASLGFLRHIEGSLLGAAKTIALIRQEEKRFKKEDFSYFTFAFNMMSHDIETLRTFQTYRERIKEICKLLNIPISGKDIEQAMRRGQSVYRDAKKSGKKPPEEEKTFVQLYVTVWTFYIRYVHFYRAAYTLQRRFKKALKDIQHSRV